VRLPAPRPAAADARADFDYKDDAVVASGPLITSRGPGTAFPFALALVERLSGAEQRDAVRAPMVFPAGTPW
jgi:protein DJ-1